MDFLTPALLCGEIKLQVKSPSSRLMARRKVISLCSPMLERRFPPTACERVAVLGGGVAGCAAAACLSRLGAQVTLIEMGRSTGGRATTRRTREDKRIEVDHGAPVAEIMTPEGLAMAQELSSKGWIENFTERVVRLQPGVLCSPAEGALPDVTRFRGTPNMSRWCEGLLDGSSIQTKFGSMISKLEVVRNEDGAVSGWRLLDKELKCVAESDWLVVTGSGIAHSRWTKTFKGPPPLVEAAKGLQDPKLDAVLAAIEGIGSLPVQVAFLGFDGDAAAAWSNLPFAIAEVQGDETIAKIVLQHRNDMVFVVAHSTHKFAAMNQDTYGSTSTAARLGNATSSEAREAEVLAELVKGLDRCIAGFSLGVSSEAASFGPLLHRWGNAFPEVGAPISAEDAFVPASRIVFAGDYVGQRSGSIEGAMLSGAAAAEMLMSKTHD